MKFTAAALATCLLVLGALACGGDEDSPSGEPSVAASLTPAEPSQTAAVPTATPSPPGVTQHSLVYIDRRKPGPAEVWVADYNGANPKMVTTSTSLRRPLDMAGKTLVAAGQNELLFIDLTTGQTRALAESVFVNDGRFVSPQTFVYITLAGCAGGIQSQSKAYKVDVGSLQVTPLLETAANLQVAGFDAASVALTPRGCDPAVTSIDVFNLATGQLMRSIPIDGCGWAGADLVRQKAAASWKACTPPANHAQDDLTVVDFRAQPPSIRFLPSAPGDPNTWPFMFRPGSNHLAIGLTRTEGTGPGSVRGGGIWLLNLDSLALDALQPPAGAEQYALDWTDDGRHLLSATVEAMGLCSFAAVDATTQQVTPVNAEINVCGANGQVVGWTVLR